MSAQSYAELGLDISSWTTASLTRLQEYVKVFDQLAKHDGTTINPILGKGLVDFNESVKTSNTLLADLNASIRALNDNGTKLSITSKNASRGIKELTDEEAKHKVAIQASNKAKTDAARAELDLANAKKDHKKASEDNTDAIKKELQAEADLMKQLQADAKVSGQYKNKDVKDASNKAKEEAIKTSKELKKAEEEEKKILKELEEEDKKYAKALKEAAKAQQDLAKAQKAEDIKAKKQALKEEAEERKRVVTALREQAKEQDRLAKQQKSADAKRKRDDDRAAAQQAKKDTADLAKVQKEAAKQKKKDDADAQKALDDEAKKVEELNDKYTQLKNLLKERQKLYVNAVANDANSPETKSALADVQQTQATINALREKMNDTEGASGRFAASLREGFSVLRQAAYILPGLGIAGIFNLAFEAVGNLVKEMGFLSSKFEKQITLEGDLADIEAQRLSILQKMIETYEALERISPWDIEREKDINDILKARGVSTDVTMAKDVITARGDVTTALTPLMDKFGTTDRVKVYEKLADNQQEVIRNTLYLNQMLKQNEKAANIKAQAAALPFTLGGGVNPLKAQMMLDATASAYSEDIIKSQESKLKNAQAQYNDLLKVAETYYGNVQALDEKSAEYKKYLEDEARRRSTEIARSAISLAQEKNEKILSDDISSYEDRMTALGKLEEEEKKLNEITLQNTLKNNSSTEADIAIARQKFADDNIKVELEYNEKRLNLNEDYNQRFLAAQEKIDTEAIQKEINFQEAIYKNEQNSAVERLAAYEKMLAGRQTLEDVQYAKNVNKRSLKAEGVVPLKEIAAEIANRDAQKANIQADAEKAAFDITTQYLDMQLNVIKNMNKITLRENQGAYTKELHNLNELYRKKLISFSEYKLRRKEIDEEGEYKTIEEDIADDQVNLKRLRDRNADLLKEQESAQTDLEGATTGLLGATDEDLKREAQKKVDIAQGVLDGTKKAVVKNGDEIEQWEQKEANDKERLERLRYNRAVALEEERLKRRKQWIDGLKAIEQSLYNFIKKTVDDEYKHRIEVIELEKAARIEAIDAEIAAVQKSSLASKDKAALDIQLNAQKSEREKKAAKEERRIKHDQAVFDKAITMSHIVLNTAAAIAEANPVVPLMIAAGVAGATELALASNVQIPAYGKGTKSHKGGWALYGEDGTEIVKEPYKSPYLVHEETMSMLPRGTEIIPLSDEPVFNERKGDGWEQTRWLAKQLRPKPQNNKHINIIKIDLGFENYKKTILGK